MSGSGRTVEYGIVLAMQVSVLAMDGAFDLGLSTVLDTLGTANELASTMDSPSPAIEVTLIGVRRRVRTAHGLSVPVLAAAKSRRPDAVVLPALGDKMPAPLVKRLTQRDVLEAEGILREWSQDGGWIGAACTSTFVLADSMLLDGHSATTSWWLAPLFRRYPLIIRLDESRMLVSSGSFVRWRRAGPH
jgi:transcriptional regulator GlxA family with amidase domain